MAEVRRWAGRALSARLLQSQSQPGRAPGHPPAPPPLAGAAAAAPPAPSFPAAAPPSAAGLRGAALPRAFLFEPGLVDTPLARREFARFPIAWPLDGAAAAAAGSEGAPGGDAAAVSLAPDGGAGDGSPSRKRARLAAPEDAAAAAAAALAAADASPELPASAGVLRAAEFARRVVAAALFSTAADAADSLL
jgi:hypothetical protein